MFCKTWELLEYGALSIGAMVQAFPEISRFFEEQDPRRFFPAGGAKHIQFHHRSAPGIDPGDQFHRVAAHAFQHGLLVGGQRRRLDPGMLPLADGPETGTRTAVAHEQKAIVYGNETSLPTAGSPPRYDLTTPASPKFLHHNKMSVQNS